MSFGKKQTNELSFMRIVVCMALSALVVSAINVCGMKSAAAPFLNRLEDSSANRVQKDGPKSVFHAASRGDHAELKRMLLAGADPNQRDPDGMPLLFYAVVNGGNTPEAVRVLLRAGADANITDQRGSTALLHAMGPRGTITNIKALLEGGADVNRANEAGETPLLIAVDSDWVEMVKLLLSRGADPNKAIIKAKNPSNIGGTPLMSAASLGRVEIVRLLLAGGANPRAKNAQGKTALNLAAEEYKNKNLNTFAQSNLRKVIRLLKQQ